MKRIEDNLIELFKNIVTGHIGLHIWKEDNEIFRKTLTERMEKLNSADPAGYLDFLGSSTGESKQEWIALIRLLTTGESYFFRDKGHFFLLKNTILPELIKKNAVRRSLRIWSAGCSTGEEPYSFAILLDMFFPVLKGWDIFILATDINDESLKRAARGIYTPWSFRMVDQAMQGRYFEKRQDGWEIHEKIKKMVHFKYGNLIEDGFFSDNTELRDMDIIICRNVLIYFGKDAVASTLNKFKRILSHGGYIITGHAELYGHDLRNLRQMLFPDAVVYKKTAELKVHTADISSPAGHIKKIKDTILKKIPRVKPLLPAAEPARAETLRPIHEIEELINNGRYTEAMDMAESSLLIAKDSFDLLYLMARVYANSGNFEKVENLCRRAIAVDADSADPYFLLGQAAEERGNDEEAKDLFKKAIYLDPAFIAAYCELGGLYEKEKDVPRARKARTAAIEFLKSLPPGSPVKPYDIAAGELLEYIEYLAGVKDDSPAPAVSGERNGR